MAMSEPRNYQLASPTSPELRVALAEAIDKLDGHTTLLASRSILDKAKTMRLMNDDQDFELYAKADHIISRTIIGAIRECGSIEEFHDWLYALDRARFQHVAADLIALVTANTAANEAAGFLDPLVITLLHRPFAAQNYPIRGRSFNFPSRRANRAKALAAALAEGSCGHITLQARVFFDRFVRDTRNLFMANGPPAADLDALFTYVLTAVKDTSK